MRFIAGREFMSALGFEEILIFPYSYLRESTGSETAALID
jgi:hypothetical protein